MRSDQHDSRFPIRRHGCGESAHADRYPLIAAAAAALPGDATIDGEAARDDAGLAISSAFTTREHDGEVDLYGFHLLELNGADLRTLALEQRKDRLRKLLQGRPAGLLRVERSVCDRAVAGLVCFRDQTGREMLGWMPADD